MIRIRVEYDKYNRSFKLLDEELGSVLQNGVQYELVAPFVLEETTDDNSEDDFLFASAATPLAHA